MNNLTVFYATRSTAGESIQWHSKFALSVAFVIIKKHMRAAAQPTVTYALRYEEGTPISRTTEQKQYSEYHDMMVLISIQYRSSLNHHTFMCILPFYCSV